MPNGYRWNHIRDDRAYRLPGPDRLGWWAAAAMVASILLHIGVFVALDRMKIELHIPLPDLFTEPVVVQRVEVTPPVADARSQPPEEVVQPPKDSAALLEEVDLLNALPKDQEIDIKPSALEPAYALQVQQPAAAGTPTAQAAETASALELEADLPEFGREPSSLKPAEVGRVTVDPGAVQSDEGEFGKLSEQILKHGAGGKVERGTLDGVVSLEEMLNLPSNILLAKKTLLPSDLLFEFNSHQLRESAKVGLMKLALLIDRNPGLHCWIEGHTDLVGGDEFNLKLSTRRAEEVKAYLVQSMRMDGNRIHTMGFGKFQPLVTSGNTEEQAVNRRVEIRMRKTPPGPEDLNPQPKRATALSEPAENQAPPTTNPQAPNPPATEEQPPKAVLVKPRRAMPVDAVIIDQPTPRAQPVQPPPPPRAQPIVPPAPPKAAPVVEDEAPTDTPPGTFRALPVTE